MRQDRLRLLTMALAMLAVACNTPPASDVQDKTAQGPTPVGLKRAVVVIRGEPFNMSRDMASVSSTGSVTGAAEISQFVSVSLADIADGTSIAGLILAEAAPTIDNGLWKLFPDGQMETTWKLRQGARWHDGAPITADDFIFATQLPQIKEVAAVRPAVYNSLAGIEAPDPYTLKLQWRQPYIEADSWFGGLEPQPKHLLTKPLEDDPATFAQHPLFTTQYVGTGPFKLKEWVLGSHLIVEAFEGYLLGRPKLDEIEVRFVLDPNVILANLLSGATDVSFGRGVSLEQGMQLRDQWREGRVEFEKSTSWVVLYPQFLNPNPSIIANLQFRRALMHTLDRQEMADTLYQGQVEVPHSIIAPGQAAYAEIQAGVVRYDYDPRRAAQLFETLGLVKRADGFYYDEGGTRLLLSLRTTAGDPAQGGLMFSTADRWKRTGIDADPDVLALQNSQDREYRANLPGFQVVTANTEFRVSNLRRYTTAEAALPENRYAGSNRGRYMNSEMDALVAQYAITIPQQPRMELARGIVSHLTENLLDLPLAYNVRPMFISRKMVNVSPELLTRNSHLWDAR
jgi:peptide/nickel transport system substrate-binding protein